MTPNNVTRNEQHFVRLGIAPPEVRLTSLTRDLQASRWVSANELAHQLRMLIFRDAGVHRTTQLERQNLPSIGVIEITLSGECHKAIDVLHRVKESANHLGLYFETSLIP